MAVDYDILDPVIDARTALDPDTPVMRDDLDDKTDNHCFDWQTGDQAATQEVFDRAEFRITEAVYLVERIVDCLAHELEMDPVELRLANLLRPEQFPYESKTGWVYDSGDYEPTMRKAMEMIGYDDLRAE